VASDETNETDFNFTWGGSGVPTALAINDVGDELEDHDLVTGDDTPELLFHIQFVRYLYAIFLAFGATIAY
jgi:hypothetical protein